MQITSRYIFTAKELGIKKTIRDHISGLKVEEYTQSMLVFAVEESKDRKAKHLKRYA